MAVEISDGSGVAHAQGHVDLLNKLVAFITGKGKLGAVNYSGTGNGAISGVDARVEAVTETWTITCTSSAINGGVFSVVGSVSGAQTDATVGSAYQCDQIEFTLTDGSADFVVGDAFTIDTTESVMRATERPWQLLREDADGFCLKGVGLAGTDEIYTNLWSLEDSGSDWFALSMQGATGFNPEDNTRSQLGGSNPYSMHAWDGEMPYWFIANGRRFIVIVKVSTTYHALYGGFYLPYFTPTEFPYPMFVGGNTITPTLRWSSTHNYDGNFWSPGNRTAAIRHLDGHWLELSNWAGSGARTQQINNNVKPWAAYGFDMSLVRDCRDGSYLLLPGEIHSNHDGGNTYGAFDGVFWVSGFGNASENVISIEGVDYLIVQDMFRTNRNDYAAIALR